MHTLGWVADASLSVHPDSSPLRSVTHGPHFTDEKTSLGSTWRPTWAHVTESEWSQQLPQPLRLWEGLGLGRQEGEQLQYHSWVFHVVPVLLSSIDVFFEGSRTCGRNFLEDPELWVWGSDENFNTGVLALVKIIRYTGLRVSFCISKPFFSAVHQFFNSFSTCCLCGLGPKLYCLPPVLFQSCCIFRAGFTVGWNLHPGQWHQNFGGGIQASVTFPAQVILMCSQGLEPTLQSLGELVSLVEVRNLAWSRRQ